jgi:hypothetical protein
MPQWNGNLWRWSLVNINLKCVGAADVLSGFGEMNIIKLHCLRPLCRQFSSSSSVFCYKSAISLENIYPKSSLSLTTPTEVGFSIFLCVVGRT